MWYIFIFIAQLNVFVRVYAERKKRRDSKRLIGIMVVFIKDCLLKGDGRRLIGIMIVFIKDCLLRGVGEDLLGS